MKIVIFAGGKGTRLWPLSTATYPKQLLDFGSPFSLLQKTILRFLPLYGASSIVVVTNQEYGQIAQSQCLEIDPTGLISVLIEPCAKGTAVALALAVRFLEETHQIDSNECILAAPSDCIFSSQELFLQAVNQSSFLAKQGSLILFGITPSKPETGFGYLQLGPLQDGAFKVETFIEKPSLPVATSLLLSGNVLWNSGHLSFTPSTFWQEMEIYCPEIAFLQTLSFKKSLEQMATLPELSLDYGLLEKSKNTLALPIPCDWSDIGSWDSLYEILPKDSQGNHKKGNVIDINSKNCLLFAESRCLSTIGLEDLLVVETNGSVLIAKKGHSQLVKQLVEKINQIESSPTFTILEETPSFKLQKIKLKPKEKIHLQNRCYQTERLVILKETAKIQIKEQIFLLKPQESVQVSYNTSYTLENTGDSILEVLQIQTEEKQSLNLSVSQDHLDNDCVIEKKEGVPCYLCE